MWKEAAMVLHKVLFRYLPGEIDENYEKPQRVSGTMFEPGTS
jgi:hypothetical protein